MARSRLVTPTAGDLERHGGEPSAGEGVSRPGFRTDRSGLYVPGADVRREPMRATPEDAKHLERALRNVIVPLWLAIAFKCAQPECPDSRVERVQNDDGGFTFRCGCTDRIFPPKY